MAGKKQVRAAFRSAVFRRDRYRCAMCGKPGRDRQGGDEHRNYHPGAAEQSLVALDAHHITDRNEMPKGGYVAENGITLCDDECHRLAEVFHQTGVPHPGYDPADLYERIGSNLEKARSASVKLA
ncbi:HNH endonuclease [Limnoglobus roseus]|uniref:HNH endonuclease n=1 Tax=Limnoglobus roseus TaxID=2598579 RepID=A0A5C1A4Z7_9BACT|nr:hypothetical protein [Limnoglobus roseus]QEL13413.1 HNH endonuclease [Limnoglobus roseus]